MSFAVLPALAPDVEKVYDIYFDSFQHDKLGSIMLEILFPGGITKEFRQAHTEGTLQFWKTSTSQYTMKCVNTETGEIVGMLLVDIFLRERTGEERRNPGLTWLHGEERERAEKIIGRLWDAQRSYGVDGVTLVCSCCFTVADKIPVLRLGILDIVGHVLAVRPDQQGRHAGAALVNWGINISNQTGLPVYLESSPSSYKLYEKFGFETLPEKIVHKAEELGTDTDIVVPLMVRMPPCAGLTFEEWRRLGYPTDLTRPGSVSHPGSASTVTLTSRL